jgi:hypothetical protein
MKKISKKTLSMMDKSMKNFAKGKVGKPIDLKELQKVEQMLPDEHFTYKVRTQVGFTGVSLYKSEHCLNTITRHADTAHERYEAKKLAEKLNAAANKGRIEALKVVNTFMSAFPNYNSNLKVIEFVKYLNDKINEQYKDILKVQYQKRKVYIYIYA